MSFSFITNANVGRVTNNKYSSYVKFCNSVHIKASIAAFLSVLILMVIAIVVAINTSLIGEMTYTERMVKAMIVFIVFALASTGSVNCIKRAEIEAYSNVGDSKCEVADHTLDYIYKTIEYHVGQVHRKYDLTINEFHQLSKYYESLMKIRSRVDIPNFLKE